MSITLSFSGDSLDDVLAQIAKAAAGVTQPVASTSTSVSNAAADEPAPATRTRRSRSAPADEPAKQSEPAKADAKQDPPADKTVTANHPERAKLKEAAQAMAAATNDVDSVRAAIALYGPNTDTVPDEDLVDCRKHLERLTSKAKPAGKSAAL